jgi:hypothetical protein
MERRFLSVKDKTLQEITFHCRDRRFLSGNQDPLKEFPIPLREKTKALRKSEKFIGNQKSFKEMKKVYKDS